MKKLMMILVAMFLLVSVASAEEVVATNGLLKIDNVIEAKLEAVPKTIIYRKSKKGEHTIYIKFEKSTDSKQAKKIGTKQKCLVPISLKSQQQNNENPVSSTKEIVSY